MQSSKTDLARADQLSELARPPSPEEAMVRRAVTLARWLDERWLDPLIGLFAPEIGDMITAAVGLYIVAAGIRKGLPAVVIARMLLNLAVDLVIGLVPAIGDIFDFMYHANTRNARMLEERSPGASTPRDWLIVVGAAVLFVVVLSIPIVSLVWLLRRFA